MRLSSWRWGGISEPLQLLKYRDRRALPGRRSCYVRSSLTALRRNGRGIAAVTFQPRIKVALTVNDPATELEIGRTVAGKTTLVERGFSQSEISRSFANGHHLSNGVSH